MRKRGQTWNKLGKNGGGQTGRQKTARSSRIRKKKVKQTKKKDGSAGEKYKYLERSLGGQKLNEMKRGEGARSYTGGKFTGD